MRRLLRMAIALQVVGLFAGNAYWPEEAALIGKWTPPPAVKLN